MSWWSTPPSAGPTVTAGDGTRLATWDLGGEGPPLLILHATGFHGAAYAPLAAALAGTFRCWAVDLRGHGGSDPSPGGDYRWAHFRDDALAAVEQLGLADGATAPVVFGHSLGGAVALLAEAHRPGTFGSLHLWEPVVFTAAMAAAVARNRSLSDLARRRRDRFPSRADALANYAGKLPFARFRADALLAYVEGGFGDDGAAGARLRCQVENEARVYEGAAVSGAYDALPAVDAPVTLACGAVTPDIGRPYLEDMAARLPRAAVEVHDGLGHFGPMEDPDRVAATVTAAVPARGGSA